MGSVPDETDPIANGPDREEGAESGTSAHLDAVRSQLRRIEHLLSPGVEAAERNVLVPAWRRVTTGEPRWPMSVVVLAAIAMEVSLPDDLVFHPRWLLPALGGLLLAGLVAANPGRVDRESPPLRAATMAMVAILSLANAWSAGRLVVHLVQGREAVSAGQLLLAGGAIWLTNVIVFALWYWELDRGGPVARAHAVRPHPDFLFPQMQSPDMAPPDWEPGFADYLYLSFTNATAFSPTDVMPLSRWAKLTMMLQSAVSLATVALVIARAVNILK
jgi:uncharacterized membrane protein